MSRSEIAAAPNAGPPSRERAEASGPDSGGVGSCDEGLRALARERFDRTARTSDAFFEDHADAVSRACWAMARRFHRAGRLLVFGRGARETDAYHVSVEFVHPVLVGKRALPALCLEGDQATALDRLARSDDIALGITSRGEEPAVLSKLALARELGLLTVGLAGGDGGALADADVDHLFVIPDDDPTVVQEVQETLYHVLWELVHVFFDHTALLETEGEAP